MHVSQKLKGRVAGAKDAAEKQEKRVQKRVDELSEKGGTKARGAASVARRRAAELRRKAEKQTS